MKQVPKYEYFLLQVKKHSYYLNDLANELTTTMATMALQGWQAKGPHQVTVQQNDYIIMSQMMKRYHPEFMKKEEEGGSWLYDADTLKDFPIVVE
jgi:hypothetical protein